MRAFQEMPGLHTAVPALKDNAPAHAQWRHAMMRTESHLQGCDQSARSLNFNVKVLLQALWVLSTK